MADEKEDLSKKCAQTGTSLKRARRYYRAGKYFVNKAAFKAYDDKAKADAAAAKEPKAA